MAIVLVLVAGCQPATSPRADAPANPWLSAIAKESPFVFANQKPLEDAEFDRLFQTVKPAMRVLADQASPSDRAFIRALISSLSDAQDWRGVGFDPNGFWAVYSDNKQPMARIPLLDQNLFWSAWIRANGPPPKQQPQGSLSTLHDIEGPYQHVVVPASSLGSTGTALFDLPPQGWLVVETQPQWLSVSWRDTAPNEMGPEIDKAAIQNDQANIQSWSEDAWIAFNQAHGLDGKFGGYVDLSALMGEQRPIDPDCQQAWKNWANQAPELIIGSQSLTAQEMTWLARLRLPDASHNIAEPSIQRPSIDVSQARLAKVAGLGLAIDIAQSRQVLIHQLQLSQEAIQVCPDLEPLNQSRRWAQGLANRPVPPIITSIQGLMTRFDGLKVGTNATLADQPSQGVADFFTEIHLQNPQFLIGLAGLFSPDLAGMDLSPNQPPQKLPSSMVEALGGVSVYLSTTHSSIRASSGNELEALTTTPHDDPNALPWVSGALNFKRLNELSDVMADWPMSAQTLRLLDQMAHWGLLTGIEQLQWLVQPSEQGIDFVISSQHATESLTHGLE